jgi:probable addiction module antidote protein
LFRYSITLSTFDAAQHLKTNQEMAVYLDEMLSENGPAMITHALSVIARASITSDKRQKAP